MWCYWKIHHPRRRGCNNRNDLQQPLPAAAFFFTSSCASPLVFTSFTTPPAGVEQSRKSSWVTAAASRGTGMFHTLSSRWHWCLENLLVYVCRSVTMCLWLAFTSWNASSMWQKWLNLIDMWVSIQICNRTTPARDRTFGCLVTGVGITWKPLGPA